MIECEREAPTMARSVMLARLMGFAAPFALLALAGCYYPPGYYYAGGYDGGGVYDGGYYHAQPYRDGYAHPYGNYSRPYGYGYAQPYGYGYARPYGYGYGNGYPPPSGYGSGYWWHAD
jgi:hypothetical protein